MQADSGLTPAAIYRAVLLAFGLVVAGLVFRALATLLLALLIVVVLAIPLASAAGRLERLHVPRAVGAAFVLVLGIALLVGLIAAIVPAFTHEINQFAASLPGIVDSLRRKLGHLTGTSTSQVGQQLQQFLNGYTQHPSKLLGPVASIGLSVAGALAAIVIVLLTALYTAIQPAPLIDGLARLVPPARRHVARRILARLGEAYLGWFRGLVIGMLVLGVLTYFGLRLAGIGYAAFFAILTAVAIIVPYFGALASSIPPILYGLAISPGKAVLVALIYLGIHQLEGNVVQPLVMARAVKLHPAAVAVGVLAVERLFGFVGLFVAVPILASVKILVEELWIRPLEASAHEASASKPTTPDAPAPEAGTPAQTTGKPPLTVLRSASATVRRKPERAPRGDSPRPP